MSIIKERGKNAARADVFVVDYSNQPVGAVTVHGSWSGLTSNTGTVTTDASGKATAVSNFLKKPSGNFIFTIDDLAIDGYRYIPAFNIVSSGTIGM